MVWGRVVTFLAVGSDISDLLGELIQFIQAN